MLAKFDNVQAGPSLKQDQHENILVHAQVHSESRIIPQENSRVIYVQPCHSQDISHGKSNDKDEVQDQD